MELVWLAGWLVWESLSDVIERHWSKLGMSENKMFMAHGACATYKNILFMHYNFLIYIHSASRIFIYFMLNVLCLKWPPTKAVTQYNHYICGVSHKYVGHILIFVRIFIHRHQACQLGKFPEVNQSHCGRRNGSFTSCTKNIVWHTAPCSLNEKKNECTTRGCLHFLLCPFIPCALCYYPASEMY